MDQIDLDYYAYLKQYKEVLITSRKDIKDIINGILVDEDMIVSPPHCINYEDWINSFSILVDDEAPRDVNPIAIIDNHHMHLFHYDNEFENFVIHVSYDIYLGSVQSCFPSIKDHIEFHGDFLCRY